VNKAFQYIPALDGLRAVAILIVMASHYGGESFVPGGFGVTLFFFISGYLITSILISEMETTGTISVSDFYIRRFFRLAPALLTMIAGVTLLFEVIVASPYIPQLLAALFYAMNYYQIFGGANPMPLGVLWSLAVEEHYYLIFPALFALGWRWPRCFLIGLCLLLISILGWRTALVLKFHVSEYRTYMATDTRLDSILYGAILAAAVTLSKRSIAWMQHWLVLAAAAATLLFTLVYRSSDFRETFRYSLQGLALMPIFYWVIFTQKDALVRRLLESNVLVWVGRISYSLYLWHFSVLYFFQKADDIGKPYQYMAAAIVSLSIASLSFYFIERPFQSLRNQFRAWRSQTTRTEAVGGSLREQPK
jgi:peptidoglycan/LPS O-acetylase OafA/YrhL